MLLRADDFDYHLPSEMIAQTPVEPRDHSRLMVLHRQERRIEHHRFFDIADYLRSGDLLVCNESRVIPARLYGHKAETGGRVEVLLIAQRAQDQVWEVLVRPGRRVRVGTVIYFADGRLVGQVVAHTEGGGRLVRFYGQGDMAATLEELGTVPLPPYVHVPLADPERYQTVYARVKGSVAAPTAGLHFTPELLARLQEMGVEFAFVTLHIGLDTFRPVQVEEVADHRMHSEYCQLSPEVATAVNDARREGRRVIAVGTTAVRMLETAATQGSATSVQPFRGWTDLFIYPGHRFRAVDALITNFHLPRSTLLMLVSAFAGRDFLLEAYAEAVRTGYRFYSFGDAMLLL